MKPTYITVLPSVLCALGVYITMYPASAAEQSAAVADTERVKNTIVTMVNAIDTKQWALVTAQFADEVFVDYSSLTGQPGSATSASGLGWGMGNIAGKGQHPPYAQ